MTTRQNQDAQHTAVVRAYYETHDETLLSPVLAVVRCRLMSFINQNLGVRCTAQAEDLAQETLVELMGELQAAKFSMRGSLVSYAITMCKHLFLNGLRLWKNKPTRPDANDDPFQFLPSTMATPATLLPENDEDNAKASLLLKAVTRVLGLDPNAREVMGCYFRGHSIKETAALLSINPKKARERLNRGMQRLRQWGRTNRHMAPTADVYAALLGIDSKSLFQE